MTAGPLGHRLAAGQAMALAGERDRAEKWRAMGWAVWEIDGHDIPSLYEAFSSAPRKPGVPTFVLCNTVKGKGVSFMENDNLWHGKAPDRDQLDRAMEEIGCKGV